MCCSIMRNYIKATLRSFTSCNNFTIITWNTMSCFLHNRGGPAHFSFVSLSNRSRICHLTPEHSSHLWLHHGTPGAHPAGVRRHFISLPWPQTQLHLFLLLSPCFLACRLTTLKTAWRGISWLRGNWKLQVQGRSCGQLKARPLISTGERSGAVRSMRRESRASMPVGTRAENSRFPSYYWWRQKPHVADDACVVEAMWTCYVTFCLERLKRKTNVPELKDKVWDQSSILKWIQEISLRSFDVFGCPVFVEAGEAAGSAAARPWLLTAQGGLL